VARLSPDAPELAPTGEEGGADAEETRPAAGA
jgi:hypothetical protein